MRKFFIYSLIFTYLLSFYEVRQLCKFPLLVEHYIIHKSNDSETTIFSFFKMHYLDKAVKDEDYQKDMNLPFKKNTVSTFLSLQIPPQKMEISLDFFLPEIYQSPSFAPLMWKTFQYSESLFKPPIYA